MPHQQTAAAVLGGLPVLEGKDDVVLSAAKQPQRAAGMEVQSGLSGLEK